MTKYKLKKVEQGEKTFRERDSKHLRLQVERLKNTCTQSDSGRAAELRQTECGSCLCAGAAVPAMTPGQHLFIFPTTHSDDHEPGLLTDPILTEPKGLQGSDSRESPD